MALCFVGECFASDGDLRDLDVTGWPCLDSLSGTAKTQDGIERNAMKNRGPVQFHDVEALDTASFLQKVRSYDAELSSQRRSDLTPIAKAKLLKYENQIVSLTGWLVLAYAGPPETTNCGDRNFHDWHLEIFGNPGDHHPTIGDPTAIICEIAPRTEQRIFRDGIRLQAFAGFFRVGKEYHSTGHPARKIRVTGFLLWDDDHNGNADVGSKVDNISANGFHHPWRSTAWEIHPVIKVEDLESVADGTLPAHSPSSPPPNAIQTPEFVTLTRPVAIDNASDETVLQPGERLEVVSRTATKIRVKYRQAIYDIPVAAIQ